MNNPFEIPKERLKTNCYAVQTLRKMVNEWRSQDYPNTTKTTKRLLNFWFKEEHINEKDEEFKYYFCQREAIETLIFCFEILKIRRFKDLMDIVKIPIFYDPAQDNYTRFTFKMATGSGKTKVMSLAIVWSYFNFIREKINDLSPNFLILAPNVIVYERLKEDFEAGKVFSNDPLIPPEWKHEWDMEIVMREEAFSKTRKGVIILTNIQRLYEREENDEAFNPVVRQLGKKPKEEKVGAGQSAQELVKRIMGLSNLIVLNDEAHHVHDLKINNEPLVWVKTIENLNENLQEKYNKTLSMQLDFSATPKSRAGNLFPWIIVDYPLAEAIDSGIVKQPIIGRILEGKEISSNKASVRYSAWIDAAVKRWEEYWRKLYEKIPNEKDKKKPVLFVMANNTKEADDIAEYLETKQKLKGKILTIHTKMNGDVSKEDLDKARQASKKIDTMENPYRAIVSVLMLREGWDVKNVSVILGLRPFTSKAKILPEQALGRGLRLMTYPLSGFDEKVDVIGNKAFEDFIRELEKEGVTFGMTNLSIPVSFETIFVDEKKLKHDFKIPKLTPRLSKKNISFKSLKISELEKPRIKLERTKEDKKINYEGRIVKHGEVGKVVVKRKWILPVPEDGDSVVAYYTQQILKEVGIPSKFSEFVPIVKEYIENYFFDKKVKINDVRVIKRMNDDVLKQRLISIFKKPLLNLIIQEQKVKFEKEFILLSKTPAYAWSKKIFKKPEKCIFNDVSCDNNLEVEFTRFLENSRDVTSYSKLEKQKTGFHVEYLNKDNHLKLYYPDFIVRTKDGTIWIVETKGREDPDVEFKDARAERWCEDATRLTKNKWSYIKIQENIFYASNETTFKGLVRHQLEVNKRREERFNESLKDYKNKK